jgi:2-keto-3-deoxy-galactonokinase
VSEATKPKLISVDWGTSNLRAYLIGREGQVTEQVSSNQGLLSQPENFEQCLLSLIGHWLDPGAPLNIILSGMVGSPSGWQEVPHLPAPATVQDLANGAARIAQPKRAVFGLSPAFLVRALRVFTTSCVAKKFSFLAPNSCDGLKACQGLCIGAFPARTISGSRQARR